MKDSGREEEEPRRTEMGPATLLLPWNGLRCAPYYLQKLGIESR